ncbi:MAG: hypothetical protein AAF970_07780, partial [Bacteroidota bacterium]
MFPDLTGQKPPPLTQLRIQTKLTAATMILVAAVAVFVFLYVPAQVGATVYEDLCARAQTIANMTALSATDGLLSEDRSSLDQALVVARQNDDLLSIHITNLDGEALKSFIRSDALQQA